MNKTLIILAYTLIAIALSILSITIIKIRTHKKITTEITIESAILSIVASINIINTIFN